MAKLLSNYTLRYINVFLLGSVLINIYILYNFFLMTDSDDDIKQYGYK
jgi:hypothetical protein